MPTTYTIQSKMIRSGHSPNSFSGPYYYAYWREDGKLRCRYLGKTVPAEFQSGIVPPARPEAGQEGLKPIPGPAAIAARPELSPLGLDCQALIDANRFMAFVERWGFIPAKGREAARKHIYNLLNAKTRSEGDKVDLIAGWQKFRKCFRSIPRSGTPGPAATESAVGND